jgi:DNA-binding transcriptional regulator LsrR (DeoR family)
MCHKSLVVCIVGGLGSTFGGHHCKFQHRLCQTFNATYVYAHWTMIVSLFAILTYGQ